MWLGEIFGPEKSPDEVAAEWIEKYNDHQAKAMCNLVNFVLKSTGCDLTVDIHDIEDPDSVLGKIEDLQDAYSAQKVTDYPLISRAKNNPLSRQTLQNFFQSLVETAHATGILYSDEALWETIDLWVGTMTSSSNRPFRHTSTVMSLAMTMGMCNNVKDVVTSSSTTVRQREAEQKKRTVNKGRIATLTTKINESERKRESAEAMLQGIFDSIFINRYRDVDPRIRIDCTIALGAWMHTCPDIFFESSYLRYFGWLLSDVSGARGEVVKQLLKLYKNPENVGRLRGFTSRYRPRIIEMGTKDADPNIRGTAVELLELIRRLGLLQPDDIDVVGRLIFDSETKVRKAIAPFFAANVEDTLEVVLDELGGAEIIDDTLGDEPDDYESPRKLWLKLKCITEVLDSYDSDPSEDNTPVPGMENLLAVGDLDSRYSLAAQVVCEGIQEARDWEAIAGYLLYDMSDSSQVSTDDPFEAMKRRCQLTEKEERLLLEVMNSAVKMRLAEAADQEHDKKGRKTKARKDELREIQEATAVHLAKVIPSLLRKYGASPSTASVVLRMQRILDLEVFQELRQDTTEYAALLDDINKQFSTHADRYVLAEASHTLLHATEFEDLEDVTETKLQELWESTIHSLRQLVQAKTRQTASLSTTVQRISNLASISDCTEIFAQEPKPVKSQKSQLAVLHILLNLLQDYRSTSGDVIDGLLKGAIDALGYHYLWAISAIMKKIENGETVQDDWNYDNFSSRLVQLIHGRPRLDDVRIAALMALLQLHAAFASFRHLSASTSDEDRPLSSLAKAIPPQGEALVLASFTAAEKAYAKKAKRHLETAEDDEDLGAQPESEPEESSDEEDGDDEEGQSRQTLARRKAALLAEKRLCDITGKIVLAIVAQVLDASGDKKGHIRKRVVRNKGKLGSNFREVLAFLDEPKAKRSHKAKAKSTEPRAKRTKTPEMSEEIVVDDDDDDEEEQQQDEANGEDAADIEHDEPRDTIEVDGNHGTGANGVEDDIMGD